MKSGLIFVLVLAAWCIAPSRAQADVGITSQDFGPCAEGEAHLYTLTNAHGLCLRITDYGATVVSVITPDRHGHLDDIALGFDSPADYAACKLNFGTMGRYINRIAGGQITLEGKTFALTKNKGANTMHGGKVGFNRHLWTAAVVSQDPPSLRLSRLSPDGEEGFPGNLQVSVTFTLSNHNDLTVHYDATTDKPTVINLSNHTLFNLSGPGHGTILDDIVQVHAHGFTPVDAESIPTGEIRSVEGTAWDLRQPTLIRTHLHDFGNTPPGYDFNYVLKETGTSQVNQVAEVFDPKSGRDLAVWTDQPGVQFYTGNLFDGSIIGKGKVPYESYCAFSLEPQHFPDSPHHPNFPSTVLQPGARYSATIKYFFSAK